MTPRGPQPPSAVTVPRAMPHFLLPAELPPATAGVPYSVQLSVTPPADPPPVFSAEGLPAGLAVPEDGLLSGTPAPDGPGWYSSLVITATGDDWEQLYPRPLMVLPPPDPAPPVPPPAGVRGMSPVRRAALGGRP